MLKLLSKAKLTIPILAFVHGALLMMTLVMFIMSSYEDELYDQIALKLTQPEMSQQEAALSILQGAHNLLKPRQMLFAGDSYINLRDNLFRSADVQLIDAKGNCGSYAHVLGRLLQRAGFEVRLAQMKCGDQWGCHILLEARVDGRFVSLDALYNLAFFRPDGALASYEEVSQNWSVYKAQTPDDYNNWFRYEDVRYTNWTKIPYLMPAGKKILKVFIGDRIETLSIRSWVLNVYTTYMAILMLGYALLLIFSFYVVVARKKR